MLLWQIVLAILGLYFVLLMLIWLIIRLPGLRQNSARYTIVFLAIFPLAMLVLLFAVHLPETLRRARKGQFSVR